LIPFLTEGWLRPVTPGSQYGSGNSWRFSAAELVKMALGDKASHQSPEWQQKSFADAIAMNLKANGAEMLATVILTPIAFKFGKKLLNKNIILPANRMLRSAGINEVKI